MAGDFTPFYSERDAAMLRIGYESFTPEEWKKFGEYKPVDNFFFSADMPDWLKKVTSNINTAQSATESGGHSGHSFAWLMRSLKLFAPHDWDTIVTIMQAAEAGRSEDERGPECSIV
jgi:hypothetical protein